MNSMNFPISKLPEQISHSLAALKGPSKATKEARAAALKNLGDYEDALGIPRAASKSIKVRLTAVKAAAENVVTQALPAPLSKSDRSSLSIDALRQQNGTLTTVLGRLAILQAIASNNSSKPNLDPTVEAAMSAVAALSPEARKRFNHAFIGSLQRGDFKALPLAAAEELFKKLGVDGYCYYYSMTQSDHGYYRRGGKGLSY